MTNRFRGFLLSAIALSSIALTSGGCSTGESPTFEQFLSLIPDTPDTRQSVAINDYVRLREEFRVMALDSGSTADQELEYLTSILKTVQSVAASPGIPNDTAYLKFNLETMHNLGLGFSSIDQEAEAGIPPQVLDIMKGQFNPEVSRQAIAVSAKDDPPVIETYAGNTIFVWGGDNEVNLSKRLTPPAYDFLGRGGRFVVQSDYVFKTTQTGRIKMAIDTQTGKQASLAEVSEYRDMAKVLSSNRAMTALMTDLTQEQGYIRNTLLKSGQYQEQDLEKLWAPDLRLTAYQTMALALAKDEKGLYALIILVHADEQTALRNVARLGQRIEATDSLDGVPWKSRISSSSITNQGRLVVAKLYGEISRYPLSVYYRFDPLFLHD